MTVAVEAAAFAAQRNFRVDFAWSWDAWAWGHFTDLRDLGFEALVLGPLHIQLSWTI